MASQQGKAALFPRGYHILYHDKGANACPACGKANWIVGRIMAQCAFCETALPLEHSHGVGARPRFIVHGGLPSPAPLPRVPA